MKADQTPKKSISQELLSAAPKQALAMLLENPGSAATFGMDSARQKSSPSIRSIAEALDSNHRMINYAFSGKSEEGPVVQLAQATAREWSDRHGVSYRGRDFESRFGTLQSSGDLTKHRLFDEWVQSCMAGLKENVGLLVGEAFLFSRVQGVKDIVERSGVSEMKLVTEDFVAAFRTLRSEVSVDLNMLPVIARLQYAQLKAVAVTAAHNPEGSADARVAQMIDGVRQVGRDIL